MCFATEQKKYNYVNYHNIRQKVISDRDVEKHCYCQGRGQLNARLIKSEGDGICAFIPVKQKENETQTERHTGGVEYYNLARQKEVKGDRFEKAGRNHFQKQSTHLSLKFLECGKTFSIMI